MKVQMYDCVTGAPRGEIEVPDDIQEAVGRVYAWMRRNACAAMGGLEVRRGTPPACKNKNRGERYKRKRTAER